MISSHRDLKSKFASYSQKRDNSHLMMKPGASNRLQKYGKPQTSMNQQRSNSSLNSLMDKSKQPKVTGFATTQNRSCTRTDIPMNKPIYEVNSRNLQNNKFMCKNIDQKLINKQANVCTSWGYNGRKVQYNSNNQFPVKRHQQANNPLLKFNSCNTSPPKIGHLNISNNNLNAQMNNSLNAQMNNNNEYYSQNQAINQSNILTSPNKNYIKNIQCKITNPFSQDSQKLQQNKLKIQLQQNNNQQHYNYFLYSNRISSNNLHSVDNIDTINSSYKIQQREVSQQQLQSFKHKISALSKLSTILKVLTISQNIVQTKDKNQQSKNRQQINGIPFMLHRIEYQIEAKNIQYRQNTKKNNHCINNIINTPRVFSFNDKIQEEGIQETCVDRQPQFQSQIMSCKINLCYEQSPSIGTQFIQLALQMSQNVLKQLYNIKLLKYKQTYSLQAQEQYKIIIQNIQEVILSQLKRLNKIWTNKYRITTHIQEFRPILKVCSFIQSKKIVLPHQIKIQRIYGVESIDHKIDQLLLSFRNGSIYWDSVLDLRLCGLDCTILNQKQIMLNQYLVSKKPCIYLQINVSSDKVEQIDRMIKQITKNRYKFQINSIKNISQVSHAIVIKILSIIK